MPSKRESLFEPRRITITSPIDGARRRRRDRLGPEDDRRADVRLQAPVEVAHGEHLAQRGGRAAPWSRTASSRAAGAGRRPAARSNRFASVRDVPLDARLRRRRPSAARSRPAGRCGRGGPRRRRTPTRRAASASRSTSAARTAASAAGRRTPSRPRSPAPGESPPTSTSPATVTPAAIVVGRGTVGVVVRRRRGGRRGRRRRRRRRRAGGRAVVGGRRRGRSQQDRREHSGRQAAAEQEKYEPSPHPAV